MASSKKPKGSDSERKILEHAHRGQQLMAEYKPKLMGKIQAFMAEAMAPGVLSKQEKERMALGMALTQQCHYCIALHVRACKLAGVTVEEIMEICAVGIMMGGGPVLTHIAEVERALNEFYLDENGEPI
ncbi:MAG: carboxymuconolactone decarboxylase family protein [Sulfuricella sp.]|jgi:AhpD family alkylhydroperoxidase|nr:carboxymuconolactone decarboxylase family protein [Sulfuricella sp.]